MSDRTYADVKRELEVLRGEAKELARGFLMQKAFELFVAHPEIQSFGWRQYTPYFNDGDPCRFGVYLGSGNISVNGVEGYEVPMTTVYSQANREAYQKERDEKTVNHKLVSEMLEDFAEEDFEEMFGDHVTVTIDRGNGIEVEEYEHD